MFTDNSAVGSGGESAGTDASSPWSPLSACRVDCRRLCLGRHRSELRYRVVQLSVSPVARQRSANRTPMWMERTVRRATDSADNLVVMMVILLETGLYGCCDVVLISCSS